MEQLGRALVTARDQLLAVGEAPVLWGVSLLVVLAPLLALTPGFGTRRLGGETARPEFSTLSWLSMLFAAGMGAGLVFWGVAESALHAANPPNAFPPHSDEARDRALAIAMVHWTLHPWAVYTFAGLAVGWFGAVRGRPLMPSAPFRRGNAGGQGQTGRARFAGLIDLISSIALVLGVAASLGQGAFQIGDGWHRMTGISPGLAELVALAAITVAALGSAVSGLQRGMKVLSNLNLGLTLLLLLYVVATGPGLGALETAWRSLSAYILAWPDLAFGLREGEDREWTRIWTVTYLLWWVAWTPFMGIFIARISRGRSIRAVILAAMIIPSAGSWLWFSGFGAAGFQAVDAGLALGDRLSDAPGITYAVMEILPAPAFGIALTLLLVFIFMVTSLDSASYVLAILARGGRGDPRPWERVVWGCAMAVLAAVTVLSGQGQHATRALAVLGAAPLTVILLAQTIVLTASAWRVLIGNDMATSETDTQDVRARRAE